MPKNKITSASLATLQFIYSFIDQFINEHWGLYAIDYNEDMDAYENFPIALIGYEIKFLVSPDSAEYAECWMNELDSCSQEYQHIMKERIKIALNGGEDNEK